MWGHMSTTDLPGSSLLAGRYRLVERLGAGGMSVVWRGFDEVLGRQVAVKVLPPSTSADPSFRRRLRAEAQAAARLSHPHITNVYDYGEATTADGEPVPYVVMELVDGESLAAVLARARLLPWPAAVRICAEVSAALAAAHSRGIVHRDVTPANVMLTSAGAKVVDFGISALIGENDIDPDGSLLGTPAYLAPERLEGGQVSPATDVYAVGLLIYRTLIGQLPWDVGTTTALLRAHQYTEPEPLPPVDGLPSAVSALVARCLEKRPDDRPSSAEVAHVLAGASAGAPGAGRGGYAGEWSADAGEDTTILPPQHPYTDDLSRGRGEHAVPPTGRGIAQVPAGSPGSPVSVGGGQRPGAFARESADAPVSPAPGSAIPVSVSDVRAALAGEPVADVARSAVPAAATSSPPVGSASPAPGTLLSPPPERAAEGPHLRHPSQAPHGVAPSRQGPHGAGARNSRFAASHHPPATPPAAGAASVPAALNVGAAAIRPPYGADDALDSAASRGPDDPPPPDQDRLARRRNGGPNTRRVVIGAGLVVLLGAAVYAWSLTAQEPKNLANTNPSGPSVVAPEANCVVSYAVWSDDGSRFRAQLTVANRDQAPVQGWQLWFIMNGDQIVSGRVNQGQDVPVGASRFRLAQHGQEVTVSSTDTLSPQKTATMQFDGRYTESNAAPMAFKLDGRTCETFVSGKPGAPSRPVEHLSNGGVRLGPVPTTSTPAPGVSIDSRGIAHVKPTVKPSSSVPVGSATPTTPSTPPTVPTTTVAPVPLTPTPTTASPTSTTPPPTTDPTPPPFPTTTSPDPLDTGTPVLPLF